ncbi:hypothetical protein [Streptomyces sp. NPDC001978]|uniref:hypothetical protein n=1 Tax=Streptomyces sp. NPDC001978 TaxID=3364627 RepID=UPI0036AA4533
MSMSTDRMAALSEKAHEAQEQVQHAISEDRKRLSDSVTKAKQDSIQRADKLQREVSAKKAEASASLAGVGTKWQEHVQSVKSRIEDRKAEVDVKRADRAADDAESYALDAINFAAAAIEEAEYATLDAVLARTDADAKHTR